MRANYFDDGRQVFSYKTVILERCNGLTIGNVTHYSSTTSRHQTKAGSRAADARLDDVPKGTYDLMSIAVVRGTIRLVDGATLRYEKVQHANAT